ASEPEKSSGAGGREWGSAELDNRGEAGNSESCAVMNMVELQTVKDKNTMVQAVMTKPGEIEYVETPVPRPGDHELLIKIMKIGICGSDIHVYHGRHPYTSYPVVQGHEVSGVVVDMGKEVAKSGNWKTGDKVTFQPQVY